MRRAIATSRPIPKIEDANVVIFKFFDDEELADESQDCDPPSGPA